MTRDRLRLRLAAFSVVAASAVHAAPAGTPVRALVVYGGHGFQTNEFFQTMRTLPGIATEFAKFPEAAARLRPGLEREVDVLVRYDMFGPASEEERRNFLALMDTGIALVALHHSIASHPDWPDYARLIGGKWIKTPQVIDGRDWPKSTFSHGEDVDVKIADRTHFICRGLADFRIRDETYGGLWVAPDVHVLLTTDHPKATPQVAWTRNHGRSRIVYIALGHDAAAYANPAFQTLLRQAILWAARRDAAAE